MNRVIKSVFAEASGMVAPLVISPDELIAPVRDPAVEIEEAIARANERLEDILEEARGRVKELLDQAYADGYAAGTRQASENAQGLIDRLEQDIADVAAERAAMVDGVEEQVLMLSIEAAEKIIRHEIKTDHTVVARTITGLLRRVRDRDEVNVRVNPSEVAAVRAMREELLSSAEGIRGLNVIDDRRVSAGGCILEAYSGDFDARIETQMEQLRTKLTDVLANELDKRSQH